MFFIGALVTILGGYGNSIFIFSFVFIVGFIATLFEKEEEARKNKIQKGLDINMKNISPASWNDKLKTMTMLK